ncbi:MAG TPA: cytochrome d ubiquinol oxidase subunit II [Candidatus Dormibacteraeota bacterium]|nr:cytochrome d ubiquinol oxidase subunit II [Candidatus Dormibacteraeota bacterium]
MNVVAFVVIAFMLTAYVMLDGYDLGVAAIAPFVAKSDEERAAAMASIGPFWNGNEVWLIAAGGALFALFPEAYASSFSGFYLPLMVVLWLLMFRGIAMELRGHLQSELWHSFWDVAFTVSSVLLIVVFGVALGNLVRGLPLDANGYFQGTFTYLLNPYALLVGVFAIATLSMHGATWLGWAARGPISARGETLAHRLWWPVLVLYVVVSGMTFLVRGMPGGASGLLLMPIVSLAALAACWFFARAKAPRRAFAASSVFIASLVATAAWTMFPYLLPSYPAGHGGLSIYATAPSPVALISALVVTIVGIAIVILYATFVLGKMLPKMRAGE